jgi:hypothetical protein
MTSKLYITKLIGAFLFVFGIFFLLLSVTNIFNDIDFIHEYDTCIDIAKYDPGILENCKSNVSSGLGVVIRDNQTHLTTGQYLKIYINQIIDVLFSVLLIIIGDFIYLSNKHKHYYDRSSKIEIKTKEKPKKSTKKRKRKK